MTIGYQKEYHDVFRTIDDLEVLINKHSILQLKDMSNTDFEQELKVLNKNLKSLIRTFTLYVNR